MSTTEKVGGSVATYVDQRVGSNRFLGRNLKKVFPDHWSFMLGEIALYSFIIVLLTGVFLTLFYKPSMTEVVYNGSYVPLKGIYMSEAYASTLDISFDVRGGLLIRQMHHWAALLFIAAMAVHMFRVFFTGAFRKPREFNWVIGIALIIEFTAPIWVVLWVRFGRREAVKGTVWVGLLLAIMGLALIAQVWQGREDRYSELRTAETAALRKIEMSYIGG